MLWFGKWFVLVLCWKVWWQCDNAGEWCMYCTRRFANSWWFYKLIKKYHEPSITHEKPFKLWNQLHIHNKNENIKLILPFFRRHARYREYIKGISTLIKVKITRHTNARSKQKYYLAIWRIDSYIGKYNKMLLNFWLHWVCYVRAWKKWTVAWN